MTGFLYFFNKRLNVDLNTDNMTSAQLNFSENVAKFLEQLLLLGEIFSMKFTSIVLNNNGLFLM